MKQLVLVVGAGGQLGGSFTEQLGARHVVVADTRVDLDVTDAQALLARVRAVCPDVIINASAYTQVDEAEQDPLTAFAVNASAVRLLARAAGDIDATLVHYSTDFVFDGRLDRPYTEEDEPNPRGVYAMSKLLGEWFAEDAPKHYVLRVESLFGGARARSSVDRMWSKLEARQPVRAFADRTVSPSYVDDVITATDTLLRTGQPYGLYHCVNSGWTTWAGLARELARLCGAPDSLVEDIPMESAGLVAARPQFAALSNARITAAGVAMPTWQDALSRYGRERARRTSGVS
jgi:dTDP-4-dehydrorhamnose reductase